MSSNHPAAGPDEGLVAQRLEGDRPTSTPRAPAQGSADGLPVGRVP